MMEIQLSKNQRLLLAQMIKNDISQFVSEHQEEYEAFLLAESNNSASTPNYD